MKMPTTRFIQAAALAVGVIFTPISSLAIDATLAPATDAKITSNNFGSGTNRDGDVATGTDLTNWAVTVSAGTETTINVGRDATNVQGSAVYIFQLPTLQIGETLTISSATLKLGLTSAVTGLVGNYDIYALTNYTGSTVTNAMFYHGKTSPAAVDTTNTYNSAPLFDNAFSSGSNYAVGSYTFTSTDLASYINGQASVGYVYFRVVQEAYDNSNRIVLGATENTTTANKPTLAITYTISAVPEPSTYAAIVGAVILGFAACRRRRAA